jgi:hypothetical protein
VKKDVYIISIVAYHENREAITGVAQPKMMTFGVFVGRG